MVLILFLQACDSQANHELSHNLEESNPTAHPLDENPLFPVLTAFHYPKNEQRNPFKAKTIKQSATLFPLNALRYVGYLKQGEEVWGLLSQPDGEVIRVRQNDYVAQNRGQIIQLDDTSLLIKEKNQQKTIRLYLLSEGQE